MLSGLLLLSSLASAHGGPEVYFVAADAEPARVAMVGGLLTESPEGWDWVCEDLWDGASLVASVQLDQRFVFATTYGLFWTDDGCSFTRAETLADEWVSSLDTGDGTLWATTSDAVWTSADGDAWSRVQGPWGERLRGLAVSDDGTVVFVVGIDGEDDDTGIVHIGHPDTGWQDVRFDIPEADVRVHGVDSASRLYVSMPLGQDTLVRIDTDGTVETLLTTPLLINGVAEVDGVLTVSVFTTGVQTSTDDGLTWSEVDGPVLTGLTSHDGALYGGAEFGQELPLALRDTGEGLQEWLTIDAIGGPRDCPADSPAATVCAEQWDGFVDFLQGNPTTDPRGGNEPEPVDEEPTGCSTLPGTAGGSLALGLLALAVRRRRVA